MSYVKTNWVDGVPPYVNAANLTKMENGIADGAVADSIADLKNVSVANVVNGERRYVMGYYAAHDAGEGFFRYSSSSSAADNLGTVIAPNSGSGRWLRLTEGADIKVKWFGATGDGTTDDSARVQAAETARQATKGVLVFGPGTYRIITQIDLGDRASWRGVRNERGANAVGFNAAYSAVRINWRPTDTTQYLFSEWRSGSFYNIFGPYTFSDLTFDVAGANGLELGRSADDAGLETSFVSGIAFQRCSFYATQQDAGDAAGTLTRPNRKILSLGNHFETAVGDCGFFGGDIQVYSSGGDMPAFTRCRHETCVQPYRFRQGGAAVSGTMNEVQLEGWFFCAATFESVGMRFVNCRWENAYTASYPNVGRITLPETFAVTAGSGTITASATMANKLYPGSLLQLTSGANTDTVCVLSVSGTAVTISTDGFTFDWSAGAASAVRLHGHGPIVWGHNDLMVQAGSPNVAPNTPCVTRVMGAGNTSLSGVLAGVGSSQDQRAMVVGNHPESQYYLNSGMYVDSCSAEVIPNPAHPFVHVTNFRSNHGNYDKDPNFREAAGNLAEEESVINRRWVYTPKSTSTSVFDWHLTPVRLVPGETNTLGQLAAWSVAANATFGWFDKSLPTAGNLKVSLRARAKSSSGTITVYAYRQSDGATTTLFSRSLGTSWQTFYAYVPVPAAPWTTSRTAASAVGLYVQPTVAADVAGVDVEELVGAYASSGTGTPEAAITAPVGSTYRREDGGAGTSFYVKESGTGNTGWVAK